MYQVFIHSGDVEEMTTFRIHNWNKKTTLRVRVNHTRSSSGTPPNIIDIFPDNKESQKYSTRIEIQPQGFVDIDAKGSGSGIKIGEKFINIYVIQDKHKSLLLRSFLINT